MPRAKSKAKARKAIPPESPPARGNATELARRLGVTQPAVAAAARTGRIKRDPDGLFDLEQAARDFERGRSHTAGPGRGKLGPMSAEPPARAPVSADDHCPTCGVVRDLQYWKTLSEREKYRKAKLERLELEGALVRRSVAEAKVADIQAMTRGLLEGVAAAVRDDLAAEGDARRCGDIVDAEIRLVLGQVAEQLAHESGEALDESDEPAETRTEADEEDDA